MGAALTVREVISAEVGRPAVAQRMVDLQMIQLAVEHLNRFSPQQWVSSTAFCQDGWTGTAFFAVKDARDRPSTIALPFAWRVHLGLWRV